METERYKECCRIIDDAYKYINVLKEIGYTEYKID
jgi:hypothetical protein